MITTNQTCIHRIFEMVIVNMAEIVSTTEEEERWRQQSDVIFAYGILSHQLRLIHKIPEIS